MKTEVLLKGTLAAVALSATSTVFHQPVGRTLLAQAPQSVTVIRAEYVQTRSSRTNGASVSDVEDGVYFLAADGRYRIDRHRTEGQRTEIVDVIRNRQVVLDFVSRVATVGSRGPLLTTPSVPGAALKTGRGGPPPGATFDVSIPARLGAKQIGELTLYGTRTTFRISVPGGQTTTSVNEIWDYHVSDPGVFPIIIEYRFETGDDVTERRLTSAMRAEVPVSTFDVPDGFTIK